MNGDTQFILKYAAAILVVVVIVALIIRAAYRSGTKLEESRTNLFSNAARRLNMQFHNKDLFGVNKLLSRFKLFEPASSQDLPNIVVKEDANSQSYLCEYTQRAVGGQAAAAAYYTLSITSDRRLPETYIVIMPSSHGRFKKMATKIFGRNLSDVSDKFGADSHADFWIFSSDPQLTECRFDNRWFRDIVSSLRDFGLELAVQVNERTLVVHTLADKKRVDDVDQLVRFAGRARKIHKVFISACDEKWSK